MPFSGMDCNPATVSAGFNVSPLAVSELLALEISGGGVAVSGSAAFLRVEAVAPPLPRPLPFGLPLGIFDNYHS